VISEYIPSPPFAAPAAVDGAPPPINPAPPPPPL